MAKTLFRLSLVICFMLMSPYDGYSGGAATQQRYTFIFDFDETLQRPSINNPKYFYPELFIRSVLGDNFFDKERGKIERFIQREMDSGVHPVLVVRHLMQKYDVMLKPKDVSYVIKHLIPTERMGVVIEKLRQNKHKVMIIGGGTFGCAVLPEFAKQFGFEREDIYSGYFKDFSDVEMKKAVFGKYRYANCQNSEMQTPYSSDKSDLIKLLKKKGKIVGKIVHIGDGENDLEVWKSGEVDMFIGFGVNRYNKTVESGSEIYVKNMDDFMMQIHKITGIQFDNVK